MSIKYYPAGFEDKFNEQSSAEFIIAMMQGLIGPRDSVSENTSNESRYYAAKAAMVELEKIMEANAVVSVTMEQPESGVKAM